MLDSVLHLDQQLFLFLNGLGSDTWDPWWLLISYKWSSIPLYLFLFIIAFRSCNRREFILLLLTIALLITCTDQVSNLAKNSFERLRPCYEPAISAMVRLVKDGCGYKYGYFSAHAANSFGLAFFFSYLFGKGRKWLGILLFTWAALVTFSRIYIGVHYPLDVLSGAATGVLIGWAFGRLFLMVKKKFEG